MKDYFKLELKMLMAEFEKIKIFTKHPTTLGSYREQVLRDYLSKFTPNYLTIKSGFVAVDSLSPSSDQTKQVDCLIFDSNSFIPYLETSDFAVIRPEALFGAVEVKSELTLSRTYKKDEDENLKNKIDEKHLFTHNEVAFYWSGSLIDSLKNIKSVADIVPSERNYISGIFAYTSNFDYETYIENFEQICIQLGISHLRELPFAICVPEKFIIIHSPYTFGPTSGTPDPSKSWINGVGIVENNEHVPLFYFTQYHVEKLQQKTNQHSSPLKIGTHTVKPTAKQILLNNK
ncbi:DUF6602 domain-containing protein [Paenibacillus glycanilyticus]|uniref:DUF6602 domain-containing protein n=1 Tax=Paenibacillus glycanilyticus TaxID=126569 RepID=UPI0019111075|nr:DUF6602 domain-containing protein [Paenibacillus glycanilyticus]